MFSLSLLSPFFSNALTKCYLKYCFNGQRDLKYIYIYIYIYI
jgi:hypothetical protein